LQILNRVWDNCSWPLSFKFRPCGSTMIDEDYKLFVPVVEAAGGQGPAAGTVRGFHGWDLHALWDDTKFVTKHCFDVERIALVGDAT
jgi:hypothetical protein